MANDDDDFRNQPVGGPAPYAPDPDGEGIVVDLSGDDDADGLTDGALKIEVDSNGGVIIDLNPQPKPKQVSNGKWDANLALDVNEGDLTRIASKLLESIDRDDRSRREWLETRARGIDLLGLRIEEPHTDAGASSAPLEGMSTVRHPLLLEAVIRFQANAGGELNPAQGPVKCRNDQPMKPENTPDDMDTQWTGHNGGPPLDPDDIMPMQVPEENTDELAEALEKDFNHYLTVVDRGYRADFDRMLFWVGFGGCMFRKVYHDPIRRMPLSRSVDPKDLIVNNAEADLDDCQRVTHRVSMRRSQIKRMQLAGVYRDVMLHQPRMELDAVEEKVGETTGIAIRDIRPEDQEYTIYECYCELDLPGFEHRDEDDHETGLELPYRVTIEKESRQVLEIRRNWREDDPNCMKKKTFVKYPFVPMFGFYEIGLLNILGNSTKALTAAWREALDAGMFANFPGFIYAATSGRQATNEFRVAAGSGMPLQTGGKAIRDMVMPLPYKEVGGAQIQFMQILENTAQRVGGTAELQVAEGKQEAPVGTTLAMIEQAKVVLAAVHIRLHAAQAEEFELLKDLFRQDPAALWRKNRKPARQWEVDQFLDALDNYDLAPAADPNSPSHMHRVMKALAIKQLQMMNPMLYNAMAVDRHIMNMMGLHDIDHLFNMNPQPPVDPGQQAPPLDPNKMMALKAKMQSEQARQQQQQMMLAQKAQNQKDAADAREQELAIESQDRAADRESRERVALMREQTEQIKTQNQLQQHLQPSGDAVIGHHTAMQQHLQPSGADVLGHQATMMGHQVAQQQHTQPSADAMLGQQTAQFQHMHPTGSDIFGAMNQPQQPSQQGQGQGTKQPFADGGAVRWPRPL